MVRASQTNISPIQGLYSYWAVNSHSIQTRWLTNRKYMIYWKTGLIIVVFRFTSHTFVVMNIIVMYMIYWKTGLIHAIYTTYYVGNGNNELYLKRKKMEKLNINIQRESIMTYDRNLLQAHISSFSNIESFLPTHSGWYALRQSL